MAAAPELATTLVAFENLDYRDHFWPGRRYEDECDRMALRALLPPSGDRVLEVGAGFGRLADEYAGYDHVVLLDPSEAMLRGAREHIGDQARFTLVSGEANHLPFVDRSFDTVVCVRMLHHLENPRPALTEFARVLRPGGVLVLETANKRNLKAILAYLTRRLRSSPFRLGSQPYVELTLLPSRAKGRRPRLVTGLSGEETKVRGWSGSTMYLHAPRDVRTWLEDVGFIVGPTRSVGLLRPTFITAHLPIGLLTGLERIVQPSLAAFTPGPSLFTRAVRQPGPEDAYPHVPSGGEG